jgi:putative membrane protein
LTIRPVHTEPILLALLVAGPPGPLTHPSRLIQALDDPTIVAIFDAANTYDIESSGLAATKATHADVRDLGRDFANAHTGVRQQGRDLAKKLGVTPTPPKDDKSARDQAEAMAKLKAAKGDAFDRAYLAHEVAYHKAVIDAINQTLLGDCETAALSGRREKSGMAVTITATTTMAIRLRRVSKGPA